MVAAVGACAVACSVLTSLDELAPTIVDGGSDSSAAPKADSSTMDAPTCAADTQKDPHNCGACGHDCCSGECLAGVCQSRVIATQQSDAAWIIADSQNVYWLIDSFNFQPVPSGTAIRRANITGTPNVTDFVTGRHVYRGNGVQTDGKSIIWVEFDLSASPPFQFSQANKVPNADGGTDFKRFGIFNPATQFGLFAGYVVGTQWVYWFATSQFDCPNAGQFQSCLFRAPTANLAQREVVYPGGLAAGAAIVADDSFVYFGSPNQVMRISTTTDAGVSAIAPSIQKAGGLALNNTTVFWTEPAGGSIALADKAPPGPDGGARTLLADSQNAPSDLVTFGSDVYWQNQDGIVRCPQSGCPASGPITVLSATQVASFALTDQCIFYSKRDAQTVNVIAR